MAKAILLNQHRPEVQQARVCLWAKGIEACGDCWEFQEPDPSDQFGDYSIGWGIHQGRRAQQRALHRVILECGFLGERTSNLFVGVAGLNGMGSLPGPVIAGRGAPYYSQLRERGPREHKRVLVLGQVPDDTNLAPFRNVNGEGESQSTAYQKWMANVCVYLAERGLEVGFRAHPKDAMYRSHLLRYVQFVHDFDEMGWSKEEVFEWADLAVAFNSNALVEAFLAGVDVLPAHPGSMCWEVRSHVGVSHRISMEGKRSWLDKVATYQWSKEEIEGGAAWAYLVSGLGCV